jgi:hypothetical protein
LWRGLVEEVAVKYNTMQLHRLALKLWVGFILAALGSVALAQSLANLESPSPDSFVESGIGLIRGWVCDAERVEISLNGGPLQAVAYGTERLDTAGACGRVNTGFGLTQNWNRIGDGVHNLRAFADGVEFADVNFTVVTLSAEEFPTGLRGEYPLRDFPMAGSSPRVRWSEPHQNFVFARAVTIPSAPDVPENPRARLESPTQGSFESGIGLIRGWVCQAERVEVRLNGGSLQRIAYGTERLDTAGVCGTPNTGFGLTFNWNALGDGVHNLRAFADGVEFAHVNFAVTTLGGEFLTGLRRQYSLGDFPSAGQTTEVRWSQPHQNFVVARTTATGPKVGILSAIADRTNRFAGLLAGPALQDDVIGMQATRTPSGEPEQVTGFAWTDPQSGASADLELADDGLPAVYRDPTGTEARLSNITATTVDVGFFRGGQAVADPVTVPVEGGFLLTLQAFVNQLRSAAQSAEAAPSGWERLTAADQGAHAANAASRGFSMNGLFVNTVWIGGVAAGETLCAVQRAAEATGLLGQIAARVACQSPTINSFLDLARTFTAQTDAPFDFNRVDPILQQACRFEEDIAEAPCGPTDPSAACLIPAALEVQEREAGEDPIPPEEPPPAVEVPAVPRDISASDGTFPDQIRVTWGAVATAEYYEVYRATTSFAFGSLIGEPTAPRFEDTDVTPGTDYWYRVKACNSAGCSDFSGPDSGYVQPVQKPVLSYSGQSTICFVAAANFGARGVCPQRCASSGAQAKIEDSVLQIDRASFRYNFNFDSRGSCTEAQMSRSGQLSVSTTASGGGFSFSFNITSGGSVIGTVNMQGSYSETFLSASGATRFIQQGAAGTVTVDLGENIDLRRATH